MLCYVVNVCILHLDTMLSRGQVHDKVMVRVKVKPGHSTT
jgi:hypothetical protein